MTDAAPPREGAMIYRPTLAQRFWRALGFGFPSRPTFDDIDDDNPEWAAGYMHTETVAHFDWRDRLRILLSGKIAVVCSTKTEHGAGKVISRAAAGVLPPSHPVQRP